MLKDFYINKETNAVESKKRKNILRSLFILGSLLLGCSESKQTTDKSLDVSFRKDARADDGGNEIRDRSEAVDSSHRFLPKLLKDVSSIALIVAHPDDEFYISPLIGEICKTKQCLLVTLTEGEAGNCGLPQGCLPSLIKVRKIELQESAKFLNMKLEHWNLGDGKSGTLNGVLEYWSSVNPASLVTRLANVLNENNVEVVFGFDPRHGTSCHADHRAAGTLLIEAAQEAKIADTKVFLIENALWAECNEQQKPIALGFQSAVLDAANLDIDVRSSWHTINEILTIHQSQYPEEARKLVENAPPERRRIFLQSLHDSDLNDIRYDEICPDLQQICQ